MIQGSCPDHARQDKKVLLFVLLHSKRVVLGMLAHDLQGCRECRFCRSKNLPLCQVPDHVFEVWEPKVGKGKVLLC